MNVARTCATAVLLMSIGGAARADDVKSSDENNPVEYYRQQSVGLTSGFDYSMPMGSFGVIADPSRGGQTLGLVGLNVDLRLLFSGVTVQPELGIAYAGGTGFSSSAEVIPGLLLGYAIPVADRLTFTPYAHARFYVPTSNGNAVVQLTGELGLEYFLGRHAYIEPVVGAGALDVPTYGQALFVFGVGYRLGVVF